MIEQLTLELNELKAEMIGIKGSQHRLEQALNVMTVSPSGLVRKLHDCLRNLLAVGMANRDDFRCQTQWAELEDAIEDLIPVKRQLPGRLFWHVYLPLKDSRHRLDVNPFDNHAVHQLEYLKIVLANALDNCE